MYVRSLHHLQWRSHHFWTSKTVWSQTCVLSDICSPIKPSCQYSAVYKDCIEITTIFSVRSLCHIVITVRHTRVRVDSHSAINCQKFWRIRTHSRKPPFAFGVGMAKSTRSAFANRMSNLHQVAATAAWEKGDDSFNLLSLQLQLQSGRYNMGRTIRIFFSKYIIPCYSYIAVMCRNISEWSWIWWKEYMVHSYRNNWSLGLKSICYRKFPIQNWALKWIIRSHHSIIILNRQWAGWSGFQMLA